MEEKSTRKYPQSNTRDVTNVAAQAGVGLIPIVGGAAAPIIAAIVAAPMEKRRADWFNRLAEGLDELRDRFEGFDPQELAENEDFVSAVYATTDAAMRASREGKRERLANVMLNIAVGKSINETLRERFISLVQQFSDEHILVMTIGRNPKAFPRLVERVKGMMAGGRGGVYLEELKQHGMSEAVFSVVTADLEREQLITGGFNVTMTAQSILPSIHPERGNAFLEFISAPWED